MAAPSKLTPEVRVKLQQAAALDCSIAEMALYCDVSRETIYTWLEKDQELSDEIDRLRERPVLAARQTVVKGVSESYSNAMDYLKRKKKLEFSERVENDITSNGKEITGITGILYQAPNDSSNNQTNE